MTQEEIILDPIDSMNSSQRSFKDYQNQKGRDGINDLPKDGQRHFRKLSKELDRPNHQDSTEKIESEITTPTSIEPLGSLLSLNQLKRENSCDHSFGCEGINKENKQNLKTNELQNKDNFLD